MSDDQARSGLAEATGGGDARQTTEVPPDRRSGQAARLVLGIVLSVLVVGGGLAFLAVDSLESAQYYRTLAELSANAPELVGESFRVAGVVEPGSLRTDPGPPQEHRFVITEEGHRLAVRYRRPLPDAFTDKQEVVVEGTLEAPGRVDPSQVLARCPSKYEAHRTPESLSGQGHPTEVPRNRGRP